MAETATQEDEQEQVVINAQDMILGRMASYAAAQLKDGNEVLVVNSENAVVTGRKEDVFEKYRKKRNIGSRDHGPYYPKAPDRIVKHTIKGMLPKNNQGRDMVKQLKTFQGNPKDLDADDADVKTTADLKGREYVTVSAISANM